MCICSVGGKCVLVSSHCTWWHEEMLLVTVTALCGEQAALVGMTGLVTVLVGMTGLVRSAQGLNGYDLPCAQCKGPSMGMSGLV